MTRFAPLLAALLPLAVDAAAPPARAILVIVDGLHYEAPERLGLPTFAALAAAGTRIDKVAGIVPYHPTHGPYADVHTSSYPNPMMMAGTIFLTPDQRMLQHSFEDAAFVANSRSYQSITDGYEFVIQKIGTDEYAVDQALDLLRRHDPDFLRIHLQNTGNGGSETLEAPADAPWRHDIWHADSPYVANAREADRQVGRLVDELKAMGRWDDTLLVVTSDHGQTKTGWHPTLPEESWLFPAVLLGPGIRRGQRIEWADQVDIVPTIARVMDVAVPNDDGGAGRVLTAALTGEETAADARGTSRIVELNRVLARYIAADAQLIVRSPAHPFLNSLQMGFESDVYGLERVMDWPELGSIEALVEHNAAVVGEMERVLRDYPPERP
ncbi:MAG TPA: sulfatase-like hydrolase/transferase [Woeseiaceae bacterium]|nr:sulfatase-like hydrolase/transferase [Woeseiaceae bacterium]